ncbi:unnamed protein product [Leuciscus chuanchicus]
MRTGSRLQQQGGQISEIQSGFSVTARGGGSIVLAEKKYTLLMVDPDAPSRKKPSRAYWRHWLLVDIKGEAFKTGDVRGIKLSAYTRPTPPQGTGLHRYQFLVFEQPEDQTLSLSSQEKSSLGNWDPQAFVQRFGLAGPVASLQFLTQNHKD